MKKGNKIRIIFWGIICIIAIIASVIGFSAYNTGHGKIGSIVYKTKPVVENFNKLNALKKYTDAGMIINAEIKGTTIEVQYNSAATTTSFIYTYEQIADTSVLKISYNKNEGQSAELITKFIIDAASIKHGYKEGDIFNKYNFEDFTQTSIKDGISIIDNASVRTVYINLDKSILSDNIIIKTEEELIEEEINNFINDAKTIYKAATNEEKENMTYYLNNNQTCTAKEAQSLKIENMTGINYYIQIKNNEIIKYYVNNDKYAIMINEKTILEDINQTSLIKKDQNELNYNKVINEITNYCK